jgi:hypothetical protein
MNVHSPGIGVKVDQLSHQRGAGVAIAVGVDTAGGAQRVGVGVSIGLTVVAATAAISSAANKRMKDER